ncbi:MAG: hypothetical protein RLY70_2957 [Planctomycetota bacterium]|jgi:hypothetical protein
MMGTKSKIAAGVALVLAGAAARLVVRDIPNFAPIAAIALFAGYLFADRRFALWVPLGAMAASDVIIGGYDLRLMAVVYASLAAPALWGPTLRRWLPIERGSTARKPATAWVGCGLTACGLVGCSLLGSLLFFATTNFAVWALGSMYEHSWEGLVHCYVRALPFFRYTLAGDLVFSASLFAGFAVIQLLAARPSEQNATSLVRS